MFLSIVANESTRVSCTQHERVPSRRQRQRCLESSRFIDVERLSVELDVISDVRLAHQLIRVFGVRRHQPGLSCPRVALWKLPEFPAARLDYLYQRQRNRRIDATADLIGPGFLLTVFFCFLEFKQKKTVATRAQVPPSEGLFHAFFCFCELAEDLWTSRVVCRYTSP